MTINEYIEARGLTRKKFLKLMEKSGWRPSEATLSRWISEKSEPSEAAWVVIYKATRGAVDG